MSEMRWIETARQARRRLDAGPHSPYFGTRLGLRGFGGYGSQRNEHGKQARIAEIANEMGIKGQTLRNYLIALDALDKIWEPEIREILERQSAAAVSVFGRWYARDVHRAYSFLIANPNVTQSHLLAAERAHRSQTIVTRFRHRPQFDEQLVGNISIGPELTRVLSSAGSALKGKKQLVAIRTGAHRFAGLDFLILPDEKAELDGRALKGHAGAITLARFEMLETYGTRAKEIWHRSVSASSVCSCVLVIFPGPAARRRFLHALPPQPDLHKGAKSAFAGVDVSPQAGTGAAARPIWHRADPSLGLMIFTSALSLLRDLSH